MTAATDDARPGQTVPGGTGRDGQSRPTRWMWPRWPGPGRRRRECGCGPPRWTASRAGCSPPGTCRPARLARTGVTWCCAWVRGLAGCRAGQRRTCRRTRCWPASLVLVAEWGLDSFGDWPEIVRVTAAFTMGVLTDLEARGADLRPHEAVDLETAAATAAVGLPAAVWAAPAPMP